MRVRPTKVAVWTGTTVAIFYSVSHTREALQTEKNHASSKSRGKRLRECCPAGAGNQLAKPWGYEMRFNAASSKLHVDPSQTSSAYAEQIGRYTLLHELAAGGMATVHLARFHGEAGFSRLMVVKRLHAQFARDPDFVCMFLDEARLASRIRHPNVVSVLDVAAHRGELLLAMEYVHGLPLSKLLRLAGPARIPLPIATAIGNGMLLGLHAAHEATSDKGTPLRIVHRDISPQNVMVGTDGVARVVDFGIASAAARLQTTAEGQVKGKLAYMAPEQLCDEVLDHRVDIFAAGIVLWEMLAGRRLIDGEPQARIRKVLDGGFEPPSRHRPEVPPELDVVVMRALRGDRDQRFATAEEMARQLARATRPALHHEVGEWLTELAQPVLQPLAEAVAAAEAHSVPPEAEERPSHTDSGSRPGARNGGFGLQQWGFVAAALVGMVALASFWPTTGERSENGSEKPSPAGEQPAEVATTTGAPQPAEDATGDAPETATTIEETTAAQLPDADEQLDEATKGGRPAPRRIRRSDPGPQPTDTSCSPPYVLLEGGLKRYKPECL